ncbi:nuclear transport factor 2 family protein [Protofrankia symbiont of Coriaria ruscifolia]|uniref:nuclear transport factor 2 family protein n=1 Tax=Protofrankia symbiont of Coriaria ruscifolia TaxID=1306542 RepID=UPI0010418BB5|nr:nuclear transport factor 2 family protein [Protofrankia symbiont of Coriaria ruscifolia]
MSGPATTQTATPTTSTATPATDAATSTAATPETAPLGPEALVDAATYADVLNFYAWQTQLLDDGHADRWALTFTEDAVFGQRTSPGRVFSGNSPAERRGREVIATSARAGVERHAQDDVVRRHWIGQVAIYAGPQPGTVQTRFYALIVETARGQRPTFHLSTTGQDVLVRAEGTWLVQERWITHDDAA